MADVRKVVTVLFTDVVGSTSLGERLDPETTRAVMSRYFDAMQAILEGHGGTVEKFIGDAIMAVFGLPTLHEDDALRAVRAAVEMREALGELNNELLRDHGVQIASRTGVNTGEVIASDGTADQKLATGDAVNVAARLEQTAEAGEILIGEDSYVLVAAAVEAEETAALLLRGKSDPVRAWRVLGLRSEVATRAASTFVGRERELAALQTAFEQASRDRICAVATIVGPPGIGKSRLSHELVSALPGEPRIAVGRCLAYGESITYAPLAEIVQQLDDVTDGDPAVAHHVDVALGRSDDRVTPEEIAWAFRKLFEAAARERPLVLVVDDIHWAEPTLLDLLEYVASFASGAPLMLLCLARPDLFDSRASWAAPRPNATVVALEPLSHDETDGLIESLVDTVSTDARDRIVAAAEGNPLFVEQILALQAEAPQEELVVPPTIQALLAARIDRLDPDEREILARASIEGRVFHRGAVAELLSEDSRAGLGTCLLSLVRKDLLRPDRALFSGDDGFRFSHVLIRDAAYSSMPKQLRAELHERYARWLQERLADRSQEYLELVPHHLEQALHYRRELHPDGPEERSLGEEAGKLLWVAARAASARMDLPAALALYDRANALLPDEPTGDLLQELGATLNRNALDNRARVVIERAIERAQGAGNRRAELLATLDRFWIPPGEPGQRENAAIGRQVEALIPELEGLGDDLGLTKAWQLVAMSLQTTAKHTRAESALQHALHHARTLGDRLEESEVLVGLLETAYDGEMPTDEAIHRCEELLRDRRGDWMIEAAVTACSSGLRAMRGEFAEARKLVDRSAAICTEFNVLNVFPWFERRDIEMLAGEYAAAEEWLRAAKEHVMELQHWWGRGFELDAANAALLCAQSRYDEAERLTVELPRDVADYIRPHIQWRSARARALAHVDRVEEAREVAEEAVAMARNTETLNLLADTLAARADVLRVEGRGADSERDLHEALSLYERKGNLVMAQRLAQ
jgi:class 3 adenylate cyclase/tetratricopeptide (TPR) repeat protein